MYIAISIHIQTWQRGCKSHLDRAGDRAGEGRGTRSSLASLCVRPLEATDCCVPASRLRLPLRELQFSTSRAHRPLFPRSLHCFCSFIIAVQIPISLFILAFCGGWFRGVSEAFPSFLFFRHSSVFLFCRSHLRI